MSSKSFKAKHGLVLRPQTLPLDPENGQLACDIADGKFKKYENGTWSEIGSGDGGGGVGTLDTLFTQTFETATLADFTQTGLVLSTTEADLINGTVTAKMTHDASLERNFMETIELPQKYRGVNLSMSLFVRSTASDGNVTVVITDMTNMVTLTTETLSLVSDPHGNENVFSFDVPEDCELLGYEVKALAQSGSPVTYVDDISVFLTKSELVQSVLEQEPDSMIRLQGTNGYGSTATRVRRFTNVVQSFGDAILYQDSAINGATFTALKSGIYSIGCSDVQAGGTGVGITLNSSNVTTNITTLGTSATNEVLAVSNAAQEFVETSWTGYLNEGDVIRIQTDGAGQTSANSAKFVMSYNGRLKQVNVNPASKITIPTSELRMEGASTRGSTATTIVRFDTLSKLRGDAFTVESDATLGTRITMKKAGLLNVTASTYQGGNSTFITLNQSNLTLSTTIPASEVLSRQGSAAGVNANGLSWSGMVKVGDVIRIASEGALTAQNSTSLTMLFQEQDIAVSVTNTQPKFSEADSSLRLTVANGLGSAGSNKIRRFSNLISTVGTDVSYTDDAVNGASFTVLEDGIYSVAYTDSFVANASSAHGISLNATDLTQGITAIPAAQRLALHFTGTSTGLINTTLSWQGFLPAGSILRPHTNGTALNDGNLVNFTIAKVGKPNITSVDVTPFVVIPEEVKQNLEFLTSSTSFGSTNTGVAILNQTASSGSGLLSVNSSATAGTTIVALKACQVNISGYFRSNAANTGAFAITRNATILTATNSDGIVSSMSAQAANVPLPITANLKLNPGDVIRFHRNATNINQVDFVTITAEGLSDQIITEVETFNSDTAPFVYAPSSTYTLATLADAPVGTFITFTYGASSNTRTQTTTAPTQSTSDMNANGIQVFARAYNAASLAAQPAVVVIQIGKGLKGKEVLAYASTGFSGELDYSSGSGTTLATEFGTKVVYSERTGLLTIDAGFVPSNATAKFVGLRLDTNASASSGYFTINASKNPALTGVNVPTKYVSTVIATGTTAVNTDITFATVLIDNAGAWNTNKWTSPFTGFVRVSGAISAMPFNTYGNHTLHKNGTLLVDLGRNGTFTPDGPVVATCSFSLIIPVVKGEALSIRTTAGMQVNGATQYGYLTFESVEVKG